MFRPDWGSDQAHSLVIYETRLWGSDFISTVPSRVWQGEDKLGSMWWPSALMESATTLLSESVESLRTQLQAQKRREQLLLNALTNCGAGQHEPPVQVENLPCILLSVCASCVWSSNLRYISPSVLPWILSCNSYMLVVKAPISIVCNFAKSTKRIWWLRRYMDGYWDGLRGIRNHNDKTHSIDGLHVDGTQKSAILLSRWLSPYCICSLSSD